jgi:hypothetical protein
MAAGLLHALERYSGCGVIWPSIIWVRRETGSPPSSEFDALKEGNGEECHGGRMGASQGHAGTGAR